MSKSKVPNYVIFKPDTEDLEVYQPDDSGRYQLSNLIPTIGTGLPNEFISGAMAGT